MNGLQELRRLACNQVRANYPNLPEAAICSKNYSDKDANGLTRCIVDFITLTGGWATRVITRFLNTTTKQNKTLPPFCVVDLLLFPEG